MDLKTIQKAKHRLVGGISGFPRRIISRWILSWWY